MQLRVLAINVWNLAGESRRTGLLTAQYDESLRILWRLKR